MEDFLPSIFIFFTTFVLCMGKVLTILLFYLCSVCFVQSAELSSLPLTTGSEELSSRYAEQIECQRHCNNFAHRAESITVPTTSVTSSATRGYQPRVTTIISALPSFCIAKSYSTQFSLYHLYGRRAIDYFLYKLCQLRL